VDEHPFDPGSQSRTIPLDAHCRAGRRTHPFPLVHSDGTEKIFSAPSQKTTGDGPGGGLADVINGETKLGDHTEELLLLAGQSPEPRRVATLENRRRRAAS
jgi:hypothetical protein